MSGSRIVEIEFSRHHLQAVLNDGRILSTPMEWYPTLQKLSSVSLHRCKVIARGRGVEWPEIDYHLSLEGMISGVGEARKSSEACLAS